MSPRQSYNVAENIWLRLTVKTLLGIVSITAIFVTAYVTIRMELSDNQKTLVAQGMKIDNPEKKVDDYGQAQIEVKSELKAQRALLEYIAGGRRGNPPVSIGSQ